MLENLTINNIALIKKQSISFDNHFSAITGESGSGKSLLLAALSLCLGAKNQPEWVGAHDSKADISALFNIQAVPSAKTWLEAHELLEEDDCLIRRVITNEGKSRCYVNGHMMPLSKLRELTEQLIVISSQHQTQSLFKPTVLREILDATLANSKTAEQVAQLHQDITSIDEQLKALTALGQDPAALSLLAYQVQELDELALEEGELASLEQTFKEQNSAETIIQDCQYLLNQLSSEQHQSIGTQLHEAEHILSKHLSAIPKFEGIIELFGSARIQLDEALSELQSQSERFSIDPEKLQVVSQRLDKIHQVARKHQIKSQALYEYANELRDKLESLQEKDASFDALQSQREDLIATYQKAAVKLSKERTAAARALGESVSKKIKALALPHGELTIEVTHQPEGKPAASGLDDIQFLLTTNPDQTPKPLHKVASGGELARVFLSLQTVCAAQSAIPTLVFDEVDVGIGGGTSELVGQALVNLAKHSQVICITHQPQVAGQANQHLKVTKTIEKKSTITRVNDLTKAEKIDELSRMLGGVEITDSTKQVASEMLLS